MKIINPFKIILFFSIFIFLFSIFSSTLFAAEFYNDPRTQGYSGAGFLPLEKLQQNLDTPTWNLDKTVASGSDNVEKPYGFMMLTAVSLAGMIGGYPGPTGTNPDGTLIYNNGAIGTSAKLIASLYDNPPVSTREYIADMGSSLGLAKPAYAQSLGQQVLSPVLNLWKTFRNITYVLFVIIFVIVGFMIMFRTKINPQTVISIESAIPNLIITLILITFSYAIVSLMIDLIYVIIYLAVGVFNQAGVFNDGGDLAIIQMLEKNVFQLGFSTGAVKEGAFSLGDIFQNMLAGQDDTISGGGGGGKLWELIAGLLGDGLTVIGYLVIGVAVLFSMFKLFFQLLMSYIGIIISVITAPFQLMLNAIPGSNSFVNWIKGLLANVLVFPAIAILFLMAAVLTEGYHTSAQWGIEVTGTADKIWQAPLLGINTEAGGVKSLLALGFIMLAPKVVSMIKEALKVEKGAGMGGALAPIAGVVGLPVQGVQQAITIGQARQYIPGLQPKETMGGAGFPSTGEPPK